ncbi:MULTISPECIES: hypothetical protein [Rhodopseudomonas]|uniref:Uncharacterized protein n=1 Tax=Rhodopseudomonas palustris TaxID=1076 RepID=A0A0D7F1F6_RHOPL|nr:MULTISPECIES: hypothetical protein [Rhodopseudomonas]KIZ46889.1 hypothetical protein OO17_05945 [Rhodopseudomonas palustris]MDF3810298.1 hypothetical protein [Rhodopseudomonas sp. BAL398]WOK20321.1 hypothetical protein RBJ75_12710 [Rhodopseudomonas sp. BAL398]
MAEEAFALSPISARASLPSDADYEAIREAFMETARGRWFLREYGKRNRNADTSMVLDAVARIEQTLVAQKQAPGQALSESLGAIRAIVGEARAGVAQAIAGLDDGTLTAAHNGARIIREVASTLRECGADARICDLLDAQLAAIDSGHRQIAAIDRQAVLTAFDLVIQRIAGLAGEDTAPSNGQPREPEPSTPLARDEARQADSDHAAAPTTVMTDAAAAVAPPAESPSQPAETTAQIDEPDSAPETGMLETGVLVTAEAPTDLAAQPAVATEPASAELTEPTAPVAPANAADNAGAYDPETAQDAVLDLVAMEMAAPDFADEAAPQAIDSGYAESATPMPAMAAEPWFDETDASKPDASQPDAGQNDAAELVAAAPGDGETRTEAESATAPTMAAESSAVESNEAESTDVPEAAPSLGAALLARGMVSKPATSDSDALAPIRRMSQAEKIAFFS